MSVSIPPAEAWPEPPTGPPPAPASARRDALPPWVIVLLVFFFGLRVVEVASESRGSPAGAHHLSAGSEKSVDTDSMQDLIEADLQAKAAYASSLPRPVARPETKALRGALKAAEELEAETDNAPGAARRVILLRALLGQQPPLAAGKNGLDPLAAFTTALPAETPPVDRARYAAEGHLWQAAFGKQPLTPHQMDALAAQIRAVPNIRWWQWPALSSLYARQGDLSEANRYALEARSRALLPLAGTGAMTLIRVGLGLAGGLLLIYFGLKAAGVFRGGETQPGLDLWPTLPERLYLSERRLGAGDLMAVFVLYLVAREVIGLLLTGFSGFGTPHLLGFPGLLAPFESAIKRMPALRRNELGVLLEAVTYLLAAVPPVAYLRSLARRRGASLADELGWSRRALWPNVAYGVAGYALALPIMLAVSLAAPRLFRHAPSPSNPVIPQLVNTSGWWATALLIGLASVAAPLVEELLFRGVFYNAAKLRLGAWPAIILTGLVFGFVHPVGVAEMLAIAVLGGVFAWMAETRKSLVPSITGHFINNFTSTLLLLFVLSG
ncbi:MAG: CPBP family intramembrane metalloprotease [Armatimonadetes bacterium]|nr:CPBP family intramembrane metalloprotease [Armatimonadota bacterium]